MEPRYPNQREYADEEVKLAIQYAKDIQGFIKELAANKGLKSGEANINTPRPKETGMNPSHNNQ